MFQTLLGIFCLILSGIGVGYLIGMMACLIENVTKGTLISGRFCLVCRGLRWPWNY
jgi:hypothetical protein